LGILIIDDVITTGATLLEVAKALNTINSSNRLYFFTLASAAREQISLRSTINFEKGVNSR
jgi:adenine/guanine phosphoribosyltransferase-like PRPP-binding protein